MWRKKRLPPPLLCKKNKTKVEENDEQRWNPRNHLTKNKSLQTAAATGNSSVKRVAQGAGHGLRFQHLQLPLSPSLSLSLHRTERLHIPPGPRPRQSLPLLLRGKNIDRFNQLPASWMTRTEVVVLGDWFGGRTTLTPVRALAAGGGGARAAALVR